MVAIPILIILVIAEILGSFGNILILIAAPVIYPC
jgi:hypothetical protein